MGEPLPRQAPAPLPYPVRAPAASRAILDKPVVVRHTSFAAQTRVADEVRRAEFDPDAALAAARERRMLNPSATATQVRLYSRDMRSQFGAPALQRGFTDAHLPHSNSQSRAHRRSTSHADGRPTQTSPRLRATARTESPTLPHHAAFDGRDPRFETRPWPTSQPRPWIWWPAHRRRRDRDAKPASCPPPPSASHAPRQPRPARTGTLALLPSRQ